MAGNPIVIDRYGEGERPVIDGDGATGEGVVYLNNQQYWEIRSLEITNDAEEGVACGCGVPAGVPASLVWLVPLAWVARRRRKEP